MLSFSGSEYEIFLRLFLAVILGGLIGLERELKKRGAGLQTYSLVALGSALFTILGLNFFSSSNSGVILDPLRIIQALAIGMGFIGGGVIFKGEDRIEGVTTAAGLWVTTAIGITVGLGVYFLSILATFLVILILTGFGFLEDKIFRSSKG